MVTPYDVTYDAAAHTATGTATGVSGELLAGLDLSGTTHTAAGTTSDPWTFTDVTGNYANANSTVTDNIGKATAVFAVTPYDVTYDGAAHTATGTATGVSGEPLAGLDLSGTTHTAAGTTTDPWTFTDVTGNYDNADDGQLDNREEDGLGDASGGGQDLRRGRPDADRRAGRLHGGRQRDGDLQPHGGPDRSVPTSSARRSRRRQCLATTTSLTTQPASRSPRRR